MDELRITSGLMKGIVSKILETVLHKKLGYKAKIQVNDFKATNDGNKVIVHLNIDGEIDESEFKKILKYTRIEE